MRFLPLALRISALALLCAGLSLADAQTIPGKPAKTPVDRARDPQTLAPVIAPDPATISPLPEVGSTQRQPLTRLKTTLGIAGQMPFEIELDPATGTAILIRGSLLAPNKQAQNDALAWLNAVRKVLRISDPATELVVDAESTDELGQSHQRVRQQYQGVPVYGAEGMLHRAGGQVVSFTGRMKPTPAGLSVVPAVAEANAIQAAKQAIGATGPLTGMFGLPAQTAELVVYFPGNRQTQPVLAWNISLMPSALQRWRVFVDAQTGAVLYQQNLVCSFCTRIAANGPKTATATDLNGQSRTINTYEYNGTFYLVDGSRAMFNGSFANPKGAIITYDWKNNKPSNNNYSQITSSNNAWNNPKGVSGHYNAGKAYEYFLNTHSRNSIDGAGGNIVSFINVAESNGGSMENAYWNGAAMFYGNGGSAFYPLAGGLDVAGHEMSHGVIQETANLEYDSQSGALNESFADVFGAMIDRDDWYIGEDITKTTYIATGRLRDLQNPHNGGTSLNDDGWQPAHMNEIYTGSGDNGGVHINSGIINKAFYLFATATTKEKAEKVWFRALSQYLTRFSQFIDMRIACIQAATDLYGAGSAEVTAVTNAFAQVGIGAGAATAPPGDLAINPGQDYILSSDVNYTGDNNRFYVSSTTGTNFVAKSQSQARNRPSVTDNGQLAYFVDTDHKMRRFSLTGAVNETVVSNDLWDNVAISKDGSRLAAVTTLIDTAIYVYDFGKAQWAKFTLYNPTYTQGVEVGNVLYADALEWDYSGENVMYDAFNRIGVSGSGIELEYWDVGFIRVWNKGGNTWGDGSVEKLVAGLPEGVSIGNPAFSKNSPFVIALDYINADGTVDVMAADLVSNNSGVIFSQDVLGYPNFSKQDNQLIFTALNTSGDTLIASMALQADKITPNGSAAGLISLAKWGVWFAQGTRVLSTAADPALNENTFQVWPNPMTDRLVIRASYPLAPEAVRVTDVLGRAVAFASVSLADGALELNWEGRGVFFVTSGHGLTSCTRTVVKE